MRIKNILFCTFNVEAKSEIRKLLIIFPYNVNQAVLRWRDGSQSNTLININQQ